MGKITYEDGTTQDYYYAVDCGDNCMLYDEFDQFIAYGNYFEMTHTNLIFKDPFY